MKKLTPSPLSPGDRQQLHALTMHPGFQVLRSLMERRVSFATVAMLEVPPDAPDRLQKIADLQAQAYARNSYSQELMDDINWQVQQEMAEAEVKAEAAEVDPTMTRLIKAALQAGYIKNEENNDNNGSTKRTN